ncbi:MAG: sensor histidine kinase [Chloroflexia bacterium]
MDPDALRQLLLILLDNAIAHTPPPGLVVARLETRGSEFTITVADSGVGIAAADLPHVFERFYRADVSRGAGGVGLGLSIAQAIAERQGGEIVAASAPNEGATFTVRLPLGEGAAAQPAEPAETLSTH